MAKQIPEEAMDKVTVEAITKMLKEMEESPEEKRGKKYWGPLYGHDSLTKKAGGSGLNVYSSKESTMAVVVSVEGTGGYTEMKQLSPGGAAYFSHPAHYPGKVIHSLKVNGLGPTGAFYAWGSYSAYSPK